MNRRRFLAASGLALLPIGAEPPAISGAVLLTDTDNTGERAETFYGDVEFRPRRPS